VGWLGAVAGAVEKGHGEPRLAADLFELHLRTFASVIVRRV
jgi:hypothetical protein